MSRMHGNRMHFSMVQVTLLLHLHRKGDPPLNVLDLSTCTIQTLGKLYFKNECLLVVLTIEDLIENSSHFGFPCVMSMESQLLAGFITRKEIKDALGMCAFKYHSYLVKFIKFFLHHNLPIFSS